MVVTLPAAGSRCPRCGAAFRCGANDAAPCACSQVTLHADQRRALQALYPACLCLACLRAIAAGESPAPPAGMPRVRSRET